MLLVGACGNGHVEETDHHFVVGLLAPGYGAIGIRVVGVVRRVVIPADRLEFGSGLNQTGFGKAVAELPVEVVVYAKQRFGGVIGADEVVLEALSAQVHVRKEAEQGGVVGESAVDFHPIIVGIGGDGDRVVVVRELQGEDALLGRALREDETNAALVVAGLTIGRVVQLEDQVRVGRNELGYAVGPVVGRAPRRVHQQQIAVGFVGLMAKCRIVEARSGE